MPHIIIINDYHGHPRYHSCIYHCHHYHKYHHHSRRNRDQKQNLEFDWSDKKEAKELDDFCSKLRNEHTCKQFYPGAARFQEM